MPMKENFRKNIGLFQMWNFTSAESNANEQKQ